MIELKISFLVTERKRSLVKVYEESLVGDYDRSI